MVTLCLLQFWFSLMDPQLHCDKILYFFLVIVIILYFWSSLWQNEMILLTSANFICKIGTNLKYGTFYLEINTYINTIDKEIYLKHSLNWTYNFKQSYNQLYHAFKEIFLQCVTLFPKPITNLVLANFKIFGPTVFLSD